MVSREGDTSYRDAGGERQEIPGEIPIAVLVSHKGTGSNLRTILDAEDRGEIRTKVDLVVSDRVEFQGKQVAGLRIAEERQIPTSVIPYRQKSSSLSPDEYRDSYSGRVAVRLNINGIKFVVSAGYNRILTARFFEEFQGFAANIHPGGLPNPDGSPFIFPDGTEAPWNQGMMTEKAVANFLSLRFATSTVHVMTPEADNGPVLRRAIIPVESGDTVDSLYARLKVAESQAMLEVLKNPPLKIK